MERMTQRICAITYVAAIRDIGLPGGITMATPYAEKQQRDEDEWIISDDSAHRPSVLINVVGSTWRYD